MSVRWYGIKGHDLRKTLSWRTGSWSWPVTGVVSDPCQGFECGCQNAQQLPSELGNRVKASAIFDHEVLPPISGTLMILVAVETVDTHSIYDATVIGEEMVAS